MPYKAAAAYFRALRDARGLSQSGLARLLHTSPKQVWKWETGAQEPSASRLAALTAVLGGDPAEVHRLLLDEDAGEEAGQALARLRLERERYGL